MPALLSAVMNPDQPHSDDLSAFGSWNAVMARFETNSDAGEAFNAQWRRTLMAMAGLPFSSLIRRVNEVMNTRPYVSDMRGWNRSDYWATPGEFMHYGGDCEDYALAKYLALRALGIPDSLMRIVIVYDLALNLPHAVLLVREPRGIFILDNQSPIVQRVESVHRYRPIYSLNHQGWWYHKERFTTNV